MAASGLLRRRRSAATSGAGATPRPSIWHGCPPTLGTGRHPPTSDSSCSPTSAAWSPLGPAGASASTTWTCWRLLAADW